jgi:glycolate oxidase iron-sulfur subunit
MSGLVNLAEPKRSSFDGHHPPDRELLADCVHCGFCLPACPTYVLWGEEMDSPRGRIYMMQKAAEGAAPLDEMFKVHMDRCLGCMACMTACPSGVEYGKLIEDTRAQVERNIPRAASDSWFRRMLFAIFPHPSRLRVFAGAVRLYQRSGVQRVLRRTGLLNLLPRKVSAMEALLPAVPAEYSATMPVRTPAIGKPRRRVGMLSGCVQQVFFQQVNAATVRVLAAEGCEVIVPAAQTCCGALMLHAGLERDAAAMAKKMIAAFEAAEVDTIVINAAGCGSTMKEHGYLLRDDPVWAERARAFSAKCRDIAEVLCEMEPIATRNPLKLRVAYHDACHLRHAQGIYREPRQILSAVPGLEIAEIAESSLCCGSAGVYNLLQPEAAEQLGDRKVAKLLETQAEAVVSANPGCLLQLMTGLRRRGKRAMPAFHLVELLDASMRGIGAAELLSGAVPAFDKTEVQNSGSQVSRRNGSRI